MSACLGPGIDDIGVEAPASPAIQILRRTAAEQHHMRPKHRSSRYRPAPHYTTFLPSDCNRHQRSLSCVPRRLRVDLLATAPPSHPPHVIRTRLCCAPGLPHATPTPRLQSHTAPIIGREEWHQGPQQSEERESGIFSAAYHELHVASPRRKATVDERT